MKRTGGQRWLRYAARKERRVKAVLKKLWISMPDELIKPVPWFVKQYYGITRAQIEEQRRRTVLWSSI